MDTGRPSKVYRDKTLNYGKNLHGLYARKRDAAGQPPRRVVVRSPLPAASSPYSQRLSTFSQLALRTRRVDSGVARGRIARNVIA